MQRKNETKCIRYLNAFYFILFQEFYLNSKVIEETKRCEKVTLNFESNENI